MSAASFRILGMVMATLCFTVACTGAKKIDVGGTCTLNSDCHSPLTCTMGKCHEGCRKTTDCQPGQVCTKVEGVGVCQLPVEAQCAEKPCGNLLICAPDLRCRSACHTAADCIDGQVCVQTLCAEKNELDVTTGHLPQKAELDAGTDAQTGGSPEVVRVAEDTSKPLDLAPPSPDLAALSTDTAVAPLIDAPIDTPPIPTDTRLSVDSAALPDIVVQLPPKIDAPPAAFDAPIDRVSTSDVPYIGSCGTAGMPCCAGDTCTDSTGCLTWTTGKKTCEYCGMQTYACCPGDICTGGAGPSGSSLVCMSVDTGTVTGKVCQRCGGTGEACCPGSQCGDSMALCESGKCCGTPNGPCCSGSLCTSANHICAPSGASMICQSCGDLQQPCCNGDKCNPGVAGMGGVCSTVSHTCIPCGGQNMPCCEGGHCSAASMVCSAGTCTCTPPPVPTSVHATPGNGQVVLTWVGGPGPDGGSTLDYSVSRSVTSGSRYTWAGNSNSSTFTDTGVANGVTYYYVITASANNCESAQSVEVSAKPAL